MGFPLNLKVKLLAGEQKATKIANEISACATTSLTFERSPTWNVQSNFCDLAFGGLIKRSDEHGMTLGWKISDIYQDSYPRSLGAWNIDQTQIWYFGAFATTSETLCKGMFERSPTWSVCNLNVKT